MDKRYIEAVEAVAEIYKSNNDTEANTTLMLELIRAMNEAYIFSNNNFNTVADIWDAID